MILCERNFSVAITFSTISSTVNMSAGMVVVREF